MRCHCFTSKQENLAVYHDSCVRPRWRGRSAMHGPPGHRARAAVQARARAAKRRRRCCARATAGTAAQSESVYSYGNPFAVGSISRHTHLPVRCIKIDPARSSLSVQGAGRQEIARTGARAWLAVHCQVWLLHCLVTLVGMEPAGRLSGLADDDRARSACGFSPRRSLSVSSRFA